MGRCFSSAACLIPCVILISILGNDKECRAHYDQGHVGMKPGLPGAGIKKLEDKEKHSPSSVDSFEEERPPFFSSEQWQGWKVKYGFAPLAEFCDSCLSVPGKCVQFEEKCQLYCGDDCRGHGKNFSRRVLCMWCRESRDQRCRDWRSCRDKCKIDCLHETYARKAVRDYERHMNEAVSRGEKKYVASLKKIVDDAMKKVDGDDKIRNDLEKQMKHFADVAGVDFPLSCDKL